MGLAHNLLQGCSPAGQNTFHCLQRRYIDNHKLSSSDFRQRQKIWLNEELWKLTLVWLRITGQQQILGYTKFTSKPENLSDR